VHDVKNKKKKKNGGSPIKREGKSSGEVPTGGGKPTLLKGRRGAYTFSSKKKTSCGKKTQYEGASKDKGNLRGGVRLVATDPPGGSARGGVILEGKKEQRAFRADDLLRAGVKY